MSKTLTQLLSDVRSALDEPVARFYTDAELTRWINDGLVDVARRTQTLAHFSATITGVANQTKYNLPTDLITLHRVEFVPASSTQVYPVQLMTPAELDQYWGSQQDTASSYPWAAAVWGFPGQTATLQLQIYPVLSSNGGTIRLWYYRLPATLTAGADIAEIPAGWESLISDYCEYRAKRKARDATWQEAKMLYDEAVDNMIDTTRAWHDTNQAITVGFNTVPSWLYSREDW